MRLLIKSVLCVFAVVAVVLGGAAWWLRTPSAERLLLEEATKLLAVQGIRLEAARLSGPLPGRLALEDLSLGDAGGPFFRTDRLELRLDFSALLQKTVRVEAVECVGPELFRLPVLPQGPQEEREARDVEEKGGGGIPVLPLRIELASLDLREGRLHGELLQNADSGGQDALFGCSVSGEASLHGGRLSADLRVDLRNQKAGSPFPLQRAALNATLRGGREGVASAFTLEGRLAARAFARDIALSYALNAALEPERLVLRSAALRGLGVSVEASADMRVPSGALRADARFEGLGLTAQASLNATLPAGGAPLSLAGEARAALRDWRGVAALTGAPLSGGPARLRLDLANADGAQSASLGLELDALSVKEPGSAEPAFAVEGLSADLRLPRVRIGDADPLLSLSPQFRLTLGKGLAGPLRWSAGTATVNADGADGGKGEFFLSLLGETRRKAPGTEALGLRGSYDLERREALISRLALRTPLSPARGAAAKELDLALRKPMRLDFAKGLSASGLDLRLKPGGTLVGDASFAPGVFQAKLALRSLPYSFFSLFTDAALPVGELQATADLSLSGQRPRGSVTLQSQVRAPGGRDKKGTAFDLRLDAALASAPTSDITTAPAGSSAPVSAGSSASVSAGSSTSSLHPLPGIVWLNGSGVFGLASGKGRDGSLAFHIPLRPDANGLPLPDNRAPLAARLYWDGALATLWQAVPLPDRHLSGQARLDLTVGGTLEKPRPSLAAHIAGGRFEDAVNGVLLRDIALEALLSPEGDLRALLFAKDSGNGTLALEATVNDLIAMDPKAPATSPALALRGQLKGLAPLHRDDLSIGLSGIFGVTGPLDTPQVSADIRVDHGEVLLSQKLGASVPSLELSSGAAQPDQASPRPATPGGPGGPSLDLRVAIPNHFFIRGMGLDSEWAGDLSISGSPAAPSLAGSLRPVRGHLDILYKSFVLSGGDITFTGGTGLNPLLHLELSYDGPDVTAVITAAGTAKKPRLLLESRPPYPKDEILARILFGKSSSELSHLEAVQLANSMLELSDFDGSSLDLLGSLRKNTGLDMLRVGSGAKEQPRASSGRSGEGNLAGRQQGESESTPSPALEAGKYINDSVYIGVEQGLGPESSAVRVEIELDHNLTLQGKSSSSSSEVGVGWKKDY